MKKPVLLLIIMSLLVIGAGGAMVLTSCSGDDKAKKAQPKPEPIASHLTGYTAEDGYDEDAANRRVVGFVVENAPDARPQWGMDDAEYSPDIVLEGEVEGGITRTLWLYDDFRKLPEQIGPMRSARPPFIRFSEFFDAIFIHWGQSHSKGEYVGANEVFKTDKVEHINQMKFADEAGMYDRDSSRGVSSEHTGIVHGDKVEAAIKEAGFRKKPKDYTKLAFNKTAEPMSDERADEVSVTFSDRTDWEDKDWTYDEEDKQYHTKSFDNDFKRDNLLILEAKTDYITKENYEGPGGASSVTYCDYDMGGGNGKLISQGTVKDIKWQKKDGKLLLIDVAASEAATEKAKQEAAENPQKDEEGNIIEPKPVVVEAKLNKGKTWIGWISNNHGGKVKIVAKEPAEESTDETEATEGE
jgi:hypothetical protein